MHIPSLENVYQTLRKQHEIVLQEREKINKIKTKLGVGDSDQSKSQRGVSKQEPLYVYLLKDFFVEKEF